MGCQLQTELTTAGPTAEENKIKFYNIAIKKPGEGKVVDRFRINSEKLMFLFTSGCLHSA